MSYMGVLFLFLAGIGLAFYAVGLLYQKIETLKLITISVSVYFTAYVLVSGIFFWADRFTVKSVAAVTMAIFSLAAFGLMAGRKKVRFSSHWEKRGLLVFVIILIGFLISLVKFDFFGMGQDQGVYQTKAIALAYGTTERQYHFEGIESLPEGDMRTEAVKKVNRLAGYDTYLGDKPTMDIEDKLGDTAAIFHGIPTFPALMALFIQMFGIANMQQVQSLFYLCSAFFVLLITEGLGLKKSARLLAVSVFALSPVVQWVMKSSLTEGFLCLLYAGILYGLLDRHHYSKYLAALFVWGFAFFHVSVYTMVPLFAVLFTLLYLETREKQYLLANCIAMLGFAVGITMMCYVSPTYSFNNIVRALTFLHEDKTILFMWCMAVVLAVLPVILVRVDVQKVYGLVKNEGFFTWFIRLVMLAVAALVIWRGVTIYREGIRWFPQGSLRGLERLTIPIFAYATGIFAFCLTLIKLFFQPKVMLENKENMVIGAAFFYGVLLMSALLRREIGYLYYYSRYLAPYIVICALAIGAFLNALSKHILAVLMVGGAAVLAPFDWTLATQKDESRVEWDVMENVLALESGNGAVVVGDDWMQTMLLPLEMTTDFDAYPLVTDSQKEFELLRERYDKIYVISGASDGAEWYDADRFSVLYRDRFVYQKDDRRYVGRLIPFAYDFYSTEMNITVLEYNMPCYEYDFSSSDYSISMFGMGGVENDHFRWINKPCAGFIANLDKKDYEVTVTLGPGVPLRNLGLDSYSVDVYVNDARIGAITLNGSSGSEFKLLLPGDLVREGRNMVSFVGKTWSPSEYGSSDARTMTISLSKVEFAPAENISMLDLGETEDFPMTGFSGNEGTFRWTNEPTATVTDAMLWPEYDYTCRVVLGPGLPGAVFGDDGVYDVNVMVNGAPESAAEIELAPGDKEFSFDIDSKYLTEGDNIISFTSDLWSPVDFGATDARQLGISIDKITFERVE